jgi:hypothetical protein
MNQLGYEATVRAMRERHIPEEKIQKFAREQWPEVAAQQDAAAVKREGMLEKEIELRGDKLMQAHGFTVIKFSQPRASKQTAGIPDRRYYRPPRFVKNGSTKTLGQRGFSLWWDAKTTVGKQAPAQREFQQLVESCGEIYLVGTDGVLREFLAREGMLIA